MHIYRSELKEKFPEVVIKYYQENYTLNQKPKGGASETDKTKTTSGGAASGTVQDATEAATGGLSCLKISEKSTIKNTASGSDAVNAAFSINLDDTNSAQISYSLSLLENQPGEELMGSDQRTSQDTSNCHMPDLQDAAM